jgi:hypothetical protein
MCACFESKISYTAPDGAGRTARLSYRCATHRGDKRDEDAAIGRAAQAFIASARRLASALPSPRPLLTLAEYGG